MAPKHEADPSTGRSGVLLENRRLSDSPASGNRVDPGLIHRQVLEKGVAIGKGQAPQLPELGIRDAERLRVIEVEVVRRKTGIGEHRSRMLPID